MIKYLFGRIAVSSFLTVLTLLSPIYIHAQAQNVWPQQKHENKTYASEQGEDRWGPNRRHYVYGQVGVNLLLADENGIYPSTEVISPTFGANLIYKLKVTNLLSLGFTGGYSGVATSFKGRAGERFIDSAIPNLPNKSLPSKRESLRWDYLTAGPYIRFNLDPKRGDRIGSSIDLGAKGGFKIGNVYNIVYKEDDGSKVNYSRKALTMSNNLSSWVYSQVNVGMVSLGANYRMSDLFKSQLNYPEPGRFSISLFLNIGSGGDDRDITYEDDDEDQDEDDVQDDQPQQEDKTTPGTKL